MTVSTKALSNNSQTISSYESYAEQYNAVVSEMPSPVFETAMRRMLEATGPHPIVLEIGSGPGLDADFIESLGAVVRRTDATNAFLELQAARGKHGELLNVLTDDLGGPYDAILALCVLIHIDRDATVDVLRKIAGALRPNGVFLVSLREGDGETGGNYHTVYWRRDGFVAALTSAELTAEWEERSIDSAGDAWLTFLARIRG